MLKAINKHHLKVLLLVLMVLNITNCRTNTFSNMETDFSAMFPSVDMNTHLRIQLPEDVIGELSKDTTILIIHNMSKEYIYLPSGFNVQLLYYSESDGWIEVENNVTYVGKGVVLYPKGALDSVTALDISPQKGYDKFRLVITGNIVLDDDITHEQVGAFLDIDLNK